MMTTTPTRFKTSELALASFLHASGIDISNIDRSNPKRVFFVFELTDQQNDLITQYDRDAVLISPKKYYTSIQALKHKIWDGDSR